MELVVSGQEAGNVSQEVAGTGDDVTPEAFALDVLKTIDALPTTEVDPEEADATPYTDHLGTYEDRDLPDADNLRMSRGKVWATDDE